MNASAIALTFIFGIVAVGSFVGFYAGSRHKMDLEQWTVAGRGFGVLLVWLLMAGEIYTTFTFLGASGWAYSKGGPALYILGYQPLIFVVAFFITPQVWEVGRKYRLQTQADFFHVRYRNKYLAAFVALVGVVFIIPYALRDTLDESFARAGRIPDAVFSAHAHNYQRYARVHDGRQVPYVVAGSGGFPELHGLGYGVPDLPASFAGLPDLTLEAYQHRAFGFLTVSCRREGVSVDYNTVVRRRPELFDSFAVSPAH